MAAAVPPGAPSSQHEGSPEGRLLRAFLTRTEDYAYLRDAEGRFQMASAALARSLGPARAEQLVGKPVPDHLIADEETALLNERGEVVGIFGITADHPDSANRLRKIIETQRDVASADLDLESVMGLLCERTLELTGADGAAVALLRDGELRFGASRGSPDHTVGEVLSLDQSLGGLAIRDRRSLVTHDARDDPRANQDRVRTTGVRSMVAVPLLHAGQPVGTLLVLAQAPNAFDDADVRTLELLSVVISAAMSHAAEFEALNRFRTVFEGASVGMVRARADGSAREVNEAILKMLGYTAEDHSTRSFDLFTHPDDLERTKELMRQLMAEEREHYDQDKRYIRKDGKVIWVHVRAWLEPRVEGEPRTAIAMIENINERKLAEIALRENSERLERLVETQRDIASAGVDLDGVMNLIVDRSQALTVAEGAIVSMIDGDELVVGAASGVVSQMVGNRRPLEQSVARYAFEARDTLLIEHAEGDPRLYRGFAEKVRDRSHICVPLFQGERPVGALNVMTTSEGPRLGEDDRRTLELLAVVLGSALSRAAEFEAKRRQVETLARFEATYTSALAGIMTLDTEGEIVDANPALQELMGYDEQEFAGTRAIDYVHPDDRDDLLAVYRRRSESESGPSMLEHRILCKDGEVLWVNSSVSFIRDSDGRPAMSVLMVQDISKRKTAEQALLAQAELNEHQARHDALTGLANRTLFSHRIERALEGAEGGQVAVMVLDLDRFKEVNDSLGHHAGDDLLKQVARRLSSVLRSSDGVALFPEDGLDVYTLLRAADVAMYTAKEEMTGYGFFDGNTHRLDVARLTLVGELRRALEKRELVLHYQPQALLGTGEVHSVEALLRWNHPERGLIGPDEFIPLAQQTGLIRPLTLYVIGEALRQCQAWERKGLELAVAVNVSARNLLDVEFPAQVKGLLSAWELDAARLSLEITEDAVLTDPVRTKAILEQLAGMGIRLAIDDFGTGYSSLAYLKRLPITEIKIDRSFVMGMATDEDDATIVRSTIDLGRNLGLEVVAEGVESEPIWNKLRELGCNIAQGYYLSRPLPPDQLGAWLLRHSAAHGAVRVSS